MDSPLITVMMWVSPSLIGLVFALEMFLPQFDLWFMHKPSIIIFTIYPSSMPIIIFIQFVSRIRHQDRKSTRIGTIVYVSLMNRPCCFHISWLMPRVLPEVLSSPCRSVLRGSSSTSESSPMFASYHNGHHVVFSVTDLASQNWWLHCYYDQFTSQSSLMASLGIVINVAPTLL